LPSQERNTELIDLRSLLLARPPFSPWGFSRRCFHSCSPRRSWSDL